MLNPETRSSGCNCSFCLLDGYNDKHVNFYWEANANDGGKFATNVKDMAQYTLVGVKLMRNETQYAVGE